ncbi:hypothetical protein AaE_002607 [Aphanomyces astaci]|uniref:Uncharacterized protein n=1 Tax=Aphanomyces astaci TaxID=112090 RepID=A0A6A5AVY1_APHAT|nr:hypothetical protein AaE_002607 [Aphanomyces astaci]
MSDGKRKRDYNRETRTCMLCGEPNVSYRKDSIVKHLIRHRSDEFAQSIEWDGAKNPLQPRQYFEERKGVNMPCYFDERANPSEDSPSQNDLSGDDFDSHLERLVAIPTTVHSEIIIRMLGSLCKQLGLPLPPIPVHQTTEIAAEEPSKSKKRQQSDKVTKMLRNLGHVQ